MSVNDLAIIVVGVTGLFALLLCWLVVDLTERVSKLEARAHADDIAMRIAVGAPLETKVDVRA